MFDHFAILNPAGPIGGEEKIVILVAFGLMMIVVIPVFVMTFLFAWRYRASNRKATYTPEWGYSGKIEAVVWLVPALIVTGLGILTWRTAHDLGPYQPLHVAQRPLNVDAVAMNWKWLFIYPGRHIATVNRLEIPTGVPVSFHLTSDSVTTSFFIPRLGTQIYAMPGMTTKLHLIAARSGDYAGRNFQFSGRGYSWMRFTVAVRSKKQFDDWVAKVRGSHRRLTPATLAALERPSVDNSPRFYAAVPRHLFATIVHQSMAAERTTGGARHAGS
jgi:cytochrome o ubiquinol oxidase subunit II